MNVLPEKSQKFLTLGGLQPPLPPARTPTGLWEVWWSNGYYPGLQIEWSGFEHWLDSWAPEDT